MVIRIVVILLLSQILLLAALAPQAIPIGPSQAWADDDDDDDDDDDGRVRGRPGSPRGQPAPAPRPQQAAGEIVTLGLDAADLAVLVAQGFQVLQEAPSGLPGLTLRRLRIPPGVALLQARETVRALPSGGNADFNHFYRWQQSVGGGCRGGHCLGWDMVGWTAAAVESCGIGVAIGMIDTGFDPSHPAFAGTRFELHRVLPPDEVSAPPAHGTAVASVLVGATTGRWPGLLPQARLVAVDVSHRSRGDERADLFSILLALDLVTSRGPRVVNLSMAGPPNLALERMLERLIEDRSLVLVAAAGNAGHEAPPAYPAAYPGVIAVTAVDRRGEVYRRAGRGGHIDFAAPGVAVWAVGLDRGTHRHSGTSFATPFVTAAAALAVHRQPDLSAEAVVAALAGTARDLGIPGRDDVFGHGLPQLGKLCTAARSGPPAVNR